MTKLVVFGDSFASTYAPGQGPNWMQTLSTKLNCDTVLMKGVCGSSVSFSSYRLFQYLEGDEYSVDDIIIFVFSSRMRSRLIHNNFDPGWASENVNFVSGNSRGNHPGTEFYKRYASYFESEIKLTDIQDYEVERFNVAMTLKQLPNFTLIISGFSNVVDFSGPEFLLADTDKFVSIDADLFKISSNELLNCQFNEFYNFFKGEVRNCHFSLSNNYILSDLLSECIKHKSRKYFDPTKFKKQFIGLAKDYEPVFREELGPSWVRYKGTELKSDWYPFKSKN